MATHAQRRVSKMIETMPTTTLRGLLLRFKWKVSLTLSLVIAESILDLLFPLFIGFAINGLLKQSYEGVISLTMLSLLAWLIGSGRRFYDTRAYAKIYTITASQMVVQEEKKGHSISTITARVSLLNELIEFLEDSLPTIVTNLIGLFGILAIILSLNTAVFWACMGVFVLMLTVNLLSGRWNFLFNKQYNDQLEKQVTSLSSKDIGLIENHFQLLMRWNIKLSDLETLNYSAIWLGIIGLLFYAPIAVIDSGVANFGLVFSVLMYVFEYVESVISLPFYIQQLIRLQEISGRLAGVEGEGEL
jgi:hypothetical protein